MTNVNKDKILKNDINVKSNNDIKKTNANYHSQKMKKNDTHKYLTNNINLSQTKLKKTKKKI